MAVSLACLEIASGSVYEMPEKNGDGKVRQDFKQHSSLVFICSHSGNFEVMGISTDCVLPVYSFVQTNNSSLASLGWISNDDTVPLEKYYNTSPTSSYSCTCNVGSCGAGIPSWLESTKDLFVIIEKKERRRGRKYNHTCKDIKVIKMFICINRLGEN